MYSQKLIACWEICKCGFLSHVNRAVSVKQLYRIFLNFYYTQRNSWNLFEMWWMRTLCTEVVFRSNTTSLESLKNTPLYRWSCWWRRLTSCSDLVRSAPAPSSRTSKPATQHATVTWADKVKGLSAPPITEPISKPSGDADLPTSESDARADGTNNDVDDGILFAYCIKKIVRF